MHFRISVLFILMLLSVPRSSGQIRRNSTRSKTPAGSSETSIDWKSLEGMYPREAFRKYPGLIKKIRTILGTKYMTFDRNLSIQGPFEKHHDSNDPYVEGTLFVQGCAPHSCGSEESYLAIDLSTGKLFFGIISSRYNNNDLVIIREDPKSALPSPLQHIADEDEQVRNEVNEDAAKLKEENELLGSKPVQLANGIVPIVMKWFQTHLHDPYSAKYLSWSKVTKTRLGSEAYWIVSVRLRGKNAFNAYRLSNCVLYIQKDKVVKDSWD
jgi:hypothetical protein